jgi:hypothetical protein
MIFQRKCDHKAGAEKLPNFVPKRLTRLQFFPDAAAGVLAEIIGPGFLHLAGQDVLTDTYTIHRVDKHLGINSKNIVNMYELKHVTPAVNLAASIPARSRLGRAANNLT